MGFLDFLGNSMFGSTGKSVELKPVIQKSTDNDKVILPLASNQQSIPSVSLGGVVNTLLSSVKADYTDAHLKLIEHLVLFNADFSNALFNIVNLGNTDIDISFDDKISASQTKKMLTTINSRAKTWYNHSAGLRGLRNDLFAQICKYGAQAAEIVPQKNLKGVEQVVLPPFTSLKFKYDSINKDYYLIQKIGIKEIVLNPKTFKYISVIKSNDTPYPIPPMLAALDSVNIELDMNSNMASVVKKFGLIGFLQMLLQAPPTMVEGKTLTAKQQQDLAKSMVDEALATLDVGMNKGALVGFQGRHELTFHSPSQGNASGVDAISRLNTENKINGLKQNPFLHGRNFSTTESLGKVILEIFILQIKNYQRTVDSFIESVILMDLQLQGFAINSVKVKSKEPSITDEGKKLDNEKKNIDNSRALYEDGLISQTERAQRLGLEQADLEAPRQQNANIEEPNDTTEEVVVDEEENLSFKMYPTIREFEYEHECGDQCGCGTSFNDNADYPNTPLLNKNNKGYFKEANETYQKTIDKFLKSFTEELNKTGKKTTATQLNNKMLSLLQKEWAATYTPEQEKVIKRWVNSAYNEFRKDKLTVFGNKNADDIPEAIFQQADFAALDYFKEADRIYLGKFISDDSTKNKITQFLKDEYLEGGFTVGDKTSIDEFSKRFGNVLKGESWKIDMIIKTSVNNMRNMGSLSYMNQAEIEKFEIQGVNDQLQCPFCAGMQGKTFELAPTFTRVEKWVNGSVDKLDENSPFLTSSFDTKGLSNSEITNKVKGMDSKELQGLGVETPPFHPRCRDLVVAVL